MIYHYETKEGLTFSFEAIEDSIALYIVLVKLDNKQCNLVNASIGRVIWDIDVHKPQDAIQVIKRDLNKDALEYFNNSIDRYFNDDAAKVSVGIALKSFSTENPVVRALRHEAMQAIDKIDLNKLTGEELISLVSLMDESPKFDYLRCKGGDDFVRDMKALGERLIKETSKVKKQ